MSPSARSSVYVDRSCNARSERRNGQINYERYIAATALYRWRIAYGWRIVSLLSRYSSPFINVSPFFLRNFGPERSMPAPSRRDVSFSGTMLTLVCPFMYIYTWASILTTSIFKTSTEGLSIVLHTSSSKTRSCLECRLKGKTVLLPPHNKREDAHICDARLKQLTIRCCCSTTFISPPIESASRDCQLFYPFVSRCMCVGACDKDVQRVFISC